MQPWEADVELGMDEAAALVQEQFPELAPVGLNRLGAGWDNVAFTLRDLVFRFPRRAVGAQLLERELAALPQIAGHLPLPIPQPLYVGRPDRGYPYPFAGYRLIPGVTACQVEWTEAERAANTVPLARFLCALHSIPVSDETLANAPGDVFEKANPAKRVQMVRERLAGLTDRGGPLEIPQVVERMESLIPTPPHTGRPCWVHGDLYARHLVVDEGRLLAGVIDWGDVYLGDPALDLSIAFTFLPAEARGEFREHYGPIDAATWDRARFRALFYGAVLLHYGVETGDEAIRRAGEYALAASV